MCKLKLLFRVMILFTTFGLLTACASDKSPASSAKSSPPTSSANSSEFSQPAVDAAYNTPTEFEVYPGERDPWLWPFSRDSIWNMPIGSDAKLVPANFTMSAHYSIDTENHYKTTTADPLLEVVVFNSGRWSDNEADIKKKSGTTYFPKNVTIPVTNGNECTTILQPDGKTLVQLQPACRPNTSSKYINGYARYEETLYGTGIYGSHWGSGLSSFGGTIRLGELTSDQPIRHALKLNVWAKKWLYYGLSYEGKYKLAYVWPADRCDSYAAKENGYHGTDPNIMMGGLLAIDGSITAESLGLKTEVGKKLFYALQNYGAYIVDDSYWDCFSWNIESGVDEEVMEKYGFSLKGQVGNESSLVQTNFSHDMQQLITHLSVVINNSETSVGGGGTPRVPLAPNLPVLDK